MLAAITVLLLYQLAGEVVVAIFDIPVPGPVVGMLLLLATLMMTGRSPKPLESVSDVLLKHLSLLFVPAGVGVIVHFHRIAADWVAIVAALLLGTVITLAVTALTMQMTGRWLRGQGGADG